MECCGRKHEFSAKVAVGRDALADLPNIARDFGKDCVLFIADANTYPVAGKKVEALLASFRVKTFVYAERELVPDEKAFGRLVIECVGHGLIVALGSGSINDLARYTAFCLQIPYIIIATAPSMDGYASMVSPLNVGGSKLTFDACAASAIIGDEEILATAPKLMAGAGIGDILGKYNSLNDWRLGRLIFGEYYCGYVAEYTKSAVEKCLSDPNNYLNLMDALVISGIAMSYVGNSRPASGAEHHLSHYWEEAFIRAGKPPVLHGVKVGVATLVILRLYRLLWDMGLNVRSVARSGEGEARGRVDLYISKWDGIMAESKKTLPEYGYVKDTLAEAGVPVTPGSIGVTREEFRDGLLHAHELRNRFTVLQMLGDMGLLEKFASELTMFYYG